MVDQTLLIFKPEVLRRGFAGQLISRFEDRGIRFVQLKLMTIDATTAKRHYAEHESKPFFDGLVDYITSGPVIVAVVECEGVVPLVRRMVGATNPANAEPGTIRGDFAVSVAENVIHASDSPESAAREIALFFNV
ncbi:nucleoside-diphosphate kinase [bacterium]|nr:nucleoside-diphosphate kinase [bacterium]